MARLLTIATELRLQIYDHLAADPYANNTALLSTCRQINQEAHVILMRAITLKIPYDIRDHSKSATSLQERWTSLPPRTRSHVRGIHFNINHIADLSIVSASQLMLQFCGPKNFIDRVKPPARQNLGYPDSIVSPPTIGDFDITFSVEDFDSQGTSRNYAGYYDWLIEFFYALQHKAMELEKTGSKEYAEVEEELLKMLADTSRAPDSFFVPILWVRRHWFEHDKRLLAWREAERVMYYENDD